MDKRKVGVLGGGQLGRMLLESANRLNIQVNILDAAASPAKQISAHDGHVEGSFKEATTIKKLAQACDVLTVEIEHVDTEILEEVSKEVEVEPHWSTLRTIKDKYAQKEYLKSHGVAVAESIDLAGKSEEDFKNVGHEFGYPFMLKSKTEAYDGRGNFVIKSEADIPEARKALGNRPLYAERWADFKMELAVMVVKTKDSTLAFPTVETIHENNICKLVYAPARNVSPSICAAAQNLAKKAIAAFKGKGVFGVEMFLLKDNSTLLINEIAPRPHNSGHYTIEACPISQYDAHLRAILDLPIPASGLRLKEPAIMLNILGGSSPDSHVQTAKKASESTASIHLYGKGDARPGRKMGHLTITAPTMADAEKEMNPLISFVDAQSGKSTPALSDFSSSKEQALVAVIMGSDSDLPKLRDCFGILDKLSISYTARITSAHRTPDFLRSYSKSARSNGIKVIIGAAGGAAHLPGMCASWTTLPVIGVPIKATHLDGVDSLYSMTQMPRGEPVATVGINNATNAALLAARILGVEDQRVAEAVKEYMEGNEREVLRKDGELEKLGPVKYLEGMGK